MMAWNVEGKKLLTILKFQQFCQTTFSLLLYSCEKVCEVFGMICIYATAPNVIFI